MSRTDDEIRADFPPYQGFAERLEATRRLADDVAPLLVRAQAAEAERDALRTDNEVLKSHLTTSQFIIKSLKRENLGDEIRADMDRKEAHQAAEYGLQTAVMDSLIHAINPIHGNWRDKADVLIDTLAKKGYRIVY